MFKSRLQNAFLMSLLVTCTAIGLPSGCKAPESRSAKAAAKELPRFGPVPAFELTDQRGALFKSTALKGAPWIANTFFTNCRTICPNLMRKVRDLHASTKASDPPVRFISITVDPDNDTPEALADYQQKFEPSSRWILLTGEFDAIRQLVVEGFHTAMGQRKPEMSEYQDITHSGKLFLVDATGEIRGYFTADDAGVAAAAKALQVLSQ